jgi:hypothetical protein
LFSTRPRLLVNYCHYEKNVCSIQRKHLKYPAKYSYFIYKRTVIPF